MINAKIVGAENGGVGITELILRHPHVNKDAWLVYLIQED